jgi:hypothetical protein
MTAIAIREGGKSSERALFAGERDFFVRIVTLGLVFARTFDVFDGMNQVAVRNHGVMRRLFKLPGAVIFRGAALVFGRMLQQFRGFQVMIHALLRHVFRIANGV